MKQTKGTDMMARGSTLLLKLAVLAIGLVVLGLSIITLPVIAREWAIEFPEIANLRIPVVVGLTATTIPFFYALLQGWKLLSYIDKGKAFSPRSVAALRRIKLCALIISAIYIAGLPVSYGMAQSDDAPGLILIYSAIFVGGPTIVALAAAVLERLLHDALQIKSENDLTV